MAASSLKATPLTCSYEVFWSHEYTSYEKCASFTIGSCSSLQSLLDYFSFYWCSLNSNFAALFFLILFFLPFLFKFMSNVKHENLFESTVYLLEWIKCPKIIASLTMIPFFNNSLEFFIIIAAANNQYADSYAFSLLYGESLIFIALIFPFFMLYFSTDVILSKNNIFREMGFFLAITIYWIIFGVIGEITITYSLLYLGFYLVYVLIIAYQSKGKLPKVSENQNLELQSNRSDDYPEENPSKYHSLKEYDPHDIHKYLELNPEFLERGPGLFFIYQNHLVKNFFSTSKIMKIIDFPFLILRKFTIPTTDPVKYNKLDLLLWPIPGIFFLAWGVFGTPSFYWFYIIAPIAAIMIFVLLITAPETEVPNYYPALQIIAWISSIVWLYRLAQILIDTLQIVSIYSNLDHNFFGLFFLANIFTFQIIIPAYHLIQKGEKLDVLFHATLFNQIFGLMIALALSNIIKNSNFGSNAFPLFDRGDAVLSVLIIGCLVGLIFFMGILLWKMIKLEKMVAWVFVIGSISILLGCLIAGIVLAVSNVK